MVISRIWRGIPLLLGLVLITGCANEGGDAKAVKGTIGRYNELLSSGYRTFNMNPLQEVTTPEVATKAYHHMAALGEGKLRMESTVKKVKFLSIRFTGKEEAAVETSEIWDFTHVDITTGKTYSQERDFIYDMAYTLKKSGDRWIIERVNTIKGESTNSVVPWPETNRQGPPKPAAGEGHR